MGLPVVRIAPAGARKGVDYTSEMPSTTFTLRPLTKADFPQVQEIYAAGLASGNASYDTEPPSWEHFQSTKLPGSTFVAVDRRDSGHVLGWVSGALVSPREVFHGVVEDSIYVRPGYQGQGIAGALLDRLLQYCRENGKWAVHSWIFPENEGSARLHASRGFNHVATYHRMAQMPYGPWAGQWRDTQVWEKLLHDELTQPARPTGAQ